MTRLVGILNLTPDSFSDGGDYPTPAAQMAAIERLLEEGADVIDIGAESTRPGATPLSAEEEWQRLFPLFKLLTPEIMQRTVLSLDTRHPENAARAIDQGFCWINDVSGFTNPAMVAAVKDSDVILVMMHSLTVPAKKEVTLPENIDVIETLIRFAEQQCDRLAAAGIARERIIFDPGLGFGKTAAQSWNIIDRIKELQALDLMLLVGHSRKSFLQKDGQAREEATLAVSKRLIQAGVDYLRVHDVPAHRAFLESCHG